jgi:uncharacterized protein DUF6603
VSGTPGTFELIALELGRALGAASGRLGGERALDTFAELGIEFPDELLADASFNSARGTIAAAGNRLGSQVAELEGAIEAGDDGRVGASLALAASIGQLIASLDQLVGALQAASSGLPGVTPQQVDAFVADLPRRLLDLLLYDLLDLVPTVGTVLETLGVVERVFVPADPASPTSADFDRIVVHLERLLPSFADPVAQLRSLYGWGDGGFDAAKLLTVLEGALGSRGLPTLLRPATPTDPLTLEAFAFDLRPTSAGSPAGLEVDVVLPISSDRKFDFPLSPPTWIASVTAGAAIAARAGGTLRPPLAIELAPPEGQLSASVSAELEARPPTPLIVLGEAGGSRLELAGLRLGGGMQLDWDSASGKATGSPSAHGAVIGGKLVIDTSGGDGLVTTLLGGGLESDFAVQLGYAPDTGLRFEGSGSLEIRLPVHRHVGPVEVDSIYLIAGLSGSKLPVELSAAFSAKLGPLTASVDRLGSIVTLDLPPGGGNIGPLQIGAAFKGPSGIGLAIDAGVISGGGSLAVGPAPGEYSGTLQFEIAGFLGVTAVGLLSTRNPDGTPGFSLLIILTADFGPGIQLGFGFTLNAVGGLLGLNRALLFEPLMEGVRSGAIESIMFPRDVVANAPRIISDLRAIFPPREGTFLVGPMAKLGWGQPTLVSVSLGVVVEIPPGDVAILGVLKVVLPSEEADVLRLQVNFAGALEFSKSRLYFFASLYHSHLLFITIGGEMGLLVAWGSDADFVISVGGFHPRFKPPPLPFPAPQRIQLSIINESFARIRCDGYFAVTTNTVQFGAHTDMFFGFSALSVQGHAGLDALIQFSPFHFVVEISTSFSVKVFGAGVWGLDINLMLEGPTPWHAAGSASISLLFFDIDVDVDFTWGDSRQTTLPPVAVLPILVAELGKRSNWKTRSPAGSSSLVSLRKLEESEAELVLHPLGALRVSQRAVPLDLVLDKVGSQKPSDANRFSLSVTSTGMERTRDLEESFAPAQFRNADDATKLSEPAFAPQHSGIELAPGGHAQTSATALTRVVRYDLSIIDSKLRPPLLRFFVYPGPLFVHWLAGASVAFNALSAHIDDLTHPYEGTVETQPEQFAVASQADNTALSGAGAFASMASAQDHLDGLVAADPGLSGTLHVLPQFEVAA